MRKNIIAFIAIVIVSMSLTACGNNTASATSTTEYSNTGSQNQTSNTVVEPTENPANVDNSGHEPDSYQSGNFQDYWEGEDFFDIVSFAEANGSVYTYWCDAEGNPLDKSQATTCTFYFSNAWRVTIHNDSLVIDNNDTLATYLIVYEQSRNGYISVCKDNSIECSKNVIQAFNTVIECLKTSSDKANPFEESGLPCY